MTRITLCFGVCFFLALTASALPANLADQVSSTETSSPSVATDVAYSESLKSATEASRNMDKEFEDDDDEKLHQINIGSAPPSPSSSRTGGNSLKDALQDKAAQKVELSEEPESQPEPSTIAKPEESKNDEKAEEPKDDAKEEPKQTEKEETPAPTPTERNQRASSSAATPTPTSHVVKDDPLAKLPVLGPLLSGGGLKGSGVL
ncbi:hypothetical protein BDV28DRAFT_40592 [Aspergillus coremiiformis]|uniref:Uncharacterized protein n=1 Tax=Aspergillus coremiiformis TaxID=138285 RepID=A0A5N6Z2Y2_9EURO|nr:hypothetical protein BDV28DRAFT_40592 [Aspergillus coremiiformis]